MNNAKNLAVATAVAATAAGIPAAQARDLVAMVEAMTSADLYPGDVVLLPIRAAGAVSVALSDRAAFKRIVPSASVVDKMEMVLGDSYTVDVAIYSVRDEDKKRIAMVVDKLPDKNFFVRILPDETTLKRMMNSPKITKVSEQVMKDANGVEFTVVTYKSENSERMRYALVPPAGVQLEFAESMLDFNAEEKTSCF